MLKIHTSKLRQGHKTAIITPYFTKNTAESVPSISYFPVYHIPNQNLMGEQITSTKKNPHSKAGLIY